MPFFFSFESLGEQKHETNLTRVNYLEKYHNQGIHVEINFYMDKQANANQNKSWMLKYDSYFQLKMHNIDGICFLEID